MENPVGSTLNLGISRPGKAQVRSDDEFKMRIGFS